VYTLLGLGAPLLFQASPTGPLLIGALLELIGAVLVLGAFLSLNKSFGLGPENRGIKVGGAYKIVRHPMYSGYMLVEVGFFLNNLSLVNLAALAISVLFLLLRLRAEERLLRNDHSYLEYTRMVQWRLIPFII
jgi:protein-S-isoprenylcysteine O-methyltransferase Ste14